MKQDKQKTGFLPKKRSKYKLTFFNENTLEDVWTICFSRTGAIISLLVIGIIIIVAISSIIVGTPIKRLLPGYIKSEDRSELVDNMLLVDSLTAEMKIHDLYISNLSAILTDKIKIDSVSHLNDSLLIASIDSLMTVDSLMPESEVITNFIKQYEEEEKYNLSIFTPTTPTDGKIFFTPLKGEITERFNPANGHFGIDIQCSRNASVSSVLDGTVISTGYTANYGYVITVQHTNNYLSVYKYNSGLLKNIGDKVQGGEKIALSGWEEGKSSKQSCILEFQLWHDGEALDPEKYITF